MSGGKFDYVQYRIEETAEELGRIIERIENPVPDEFNYEFSKETIDKFKECYRMLSVGGKILNRIDWLLCDDDGEESFHERLKEDLEI